MEKISIAEALRELDRIDGLLTMRRAHITRYCSKRRKSRDEIEKQKEYVKNQFQSAKDLLIRYRDIKIAMQKANLTSTFTFNGKEYSIAEALLYKQYLKEQYQTLYNSFSPQNAERQLLAWRETLVNLTPEQLEAIDMVPELYYDEKKIQKAKEDLLGLMTSIDALIDKSNHTVTISV